MCPDTAAHSPRSRESCMFANRDPTSALNRHNHRVKYQQRDTKCCFSITDANKQALSSSTYLHARFQTRRSSTIAAAPPIARAAQAGFRSTGSCHRSCHDLQGFARNARAASPPAPYTHGPGAQCIRVRQVQGKPTSSVRTWGPLAVSMYRSAASTVMSTSKLAFAADCGALPSHRSNGHNCDRDLAGSNDSVEQRCERRAW